MEKYNYRILVTGSREWPSSEFVDTVLRNAVTSVIKGMEWFEGEVSITIVHGNAIGADKMADLAARKMKALGLNVIAESHPANWGKYGKRAGFVRNKEMVDLGANVCIAFIFDNSRGATMCANLADEASIPVIRYTEAALTPAQEGATVEP